MHGVVTSLGHFEGKIILRDDDVFVIEKASRYFPGSDSDSIGFHSVIYKASDVEFDIRRHLCHSNNLHKALHRYQRNLTSPFRQTGSQVRTEGNTSGYLDSRDSDKQSQVDTAILLDKDLSVISFTHPKNEILEPIFYDGKSSDDNAQTGMSTDAFLSEAASSNYHNIYVRRKRAVSVNDRTICELYLQADHLFYQHFGSNTETVIEQLTHHVQAVNAIYKNVGEFNDVVKIMIYDTKFIYLFF